MPKDLYFTSILIKTALLGIKVKKKSTQLMFKETVLLHGEIAITVFSKYTPLGIFPI